jgi:hypothetical protein
MLTVRVTTVVALGAALGHAQNTATFEPTDKVMERVPPTVWHEAISEANATSKAIKIKGPSLDDKNLALVDWETTVAIVGNYEATNVSNNGLNYLTGAEVSFKAPFKEQPEHWTTCVGVTVVDSDNKGDVDSSCRGSLSDECWEALNEWVKKGRFCTPPVVPPSACEKAFASGRTRTFRGPLGPNVKMGIEGDLSSPDDFRQYDRLTKGVFVSMIASVVANEDKFPSDWLRGEGSLTCLRASEIKEGSRVPEWPEKESSEDEDQSKNEDEDKGKDESKDKPGEGAASSLRLGMGSIFALVLASVAVLSL